MAKFVQFTLEAGAPIWIDVEQVKAITPATDGGARLWVGGGDFFEVVAPLARVVELVAGRLAPATVHHLHQVVAD